MSGLASLGHDGLVHLASWTAIWLNESPRWLCEINEFIVATGEGAMWRLQGDNGQVTEEWLLATEAVVDFCAGVLSER